MKDITVLLEVQADGFMPLTIKADEEPHSEKDLLKYPEYKPFYLDVELGGPIKATVTVKDGLLKQHKYSFTYTIEGNSVPSQWFADRILDTVCHGGFTRSFASVNLYAFYFSSSDYELSRETYSRFEGICNIYAKHYQNEDGDYVVQVEFAPVTDADIEKTQKLKTINRDDLLVKFVIMLQNRGRALTLPASIKEFFRLEAIVYRWNYLQVINYYKNNGMLNTAEDYGKATSLIALNCLFSGIYAAKLESANNVMGDTFECLIDQYDIEHLYKAVMETHGIDPDSKKGTTLFGDAAYINKVAASFNNRFTDDDQVIEIYYALYRTGLIIGANLLNSVQ